jgi:deoxyribodipyrimidine photolyase-related protein
MRHLIIVLGDQLTADAAAFDGFDAAQDVAWMAEVDEESTQAPSTKMRTAVFLSAMRHFRDSLRVRRVPLHYTELTAPDNTHTLSGELARAVARLRPAALVITEPGDYRVLQSVRAIARRFDIALDIRPDRHFYGSVDDFRRHAAGRPQLRMEYFYREMRIKHRVLLTGSGEPEGGKWSFDAENRQHFDRNGPGAFLPAPRAFQPDPITTEVIALVKKRFAALYGEVDAFDWPVTPEDASCALVDFIEHRLPHFGRYQDAMWTDEPVLYHSRLSAAMNLKLLNPRDVVRAAERAYHSGKVSLASAEGFVRQILGWREYVRGIYWMNMPDYAQTNTLGADQALPKLYWTGETEMACLRAAIGQTLKYGYAHHIQRLMVTGLYAMLLGVRPKEICDWYLAVYVDAVEWVELPNTHGMSQYADGGLMGSKPYAATGRYIDRMSNYCRQCRFDPASHVGDEACPFTTLYWDFLAAHEPLFAANRRMVYPLKNLARFSAEEMAAIRARAAAIRAAGGAPPKAASPAQGRLLD